MRRVLLVEDNPGDVRLTQRAFKDFPVEWEVVTDGEAALDRLFDTTKDWPDLVLLDLNLPRVTGWEVLEQIKRSPITRRIPVVVLTSSKSEMDIARATDKHANNYVIKPATPDAFRKLAADFDAWWFGHNQFPPHVDLVPWGGGDRAAE